MIKDQEIKVLSCRVQKTLAEAFEEKIKDARYPNVNYALKIMIEDVVQGRIELTKVGTQ